MYLKLYEEENYLFPSTRYQGSKNKLTDWIECVLKKQNLLYDTVLDGFGGSGSVSYMFKKLGKTVTYNDILKFNSIIGKALIENSNTTISSKDLEKILTRRENIDYPTFIYDNFKDIYYTDDENRWLDMIITNIRNLEDEKKKSMAYFALFQACIIKRPYNLFHRKNLYMRTDNNIKRSFGNKTTWDTSFEEHFKKFIDEANLSIFSNGRINKVLNEDIMEIRNNFDLVYLDPPYVSSKGNGVDYLDFYHFLEGISNYDEWSSKIDLTSKNKRFKRLESVSKWSKKNIIKECFKELIQKYKDSVIIISYRKDGIPTLQEIEEILRKYKKEVIIELKSDYKYALSKKKTSEVLIIAK